jgi:hypothetical protein
MTVCIELGVIALVCLHIAYAVYCLVTGGRELKTLLGQYLEAAEEKRAEFVASAQAATPVVESQPAIALTQARAAQRSDLCEVLHRQHGEWVHHHWVREGSTAYHEALSRHGYQIRTGMGTTIEGGR